MNVLMNVDLAARVRALPWWHSIDLGGGIVTPGHKSLEVEAQEAAAFFDRVDLAGRSVLDIGAWNGVYSFEAKRRGAGRVLATDSYCWTSTQWHGRETFDLAREVLGIDVEAREIDAGDINPETVGTFDAVLLLGVFYHRYDAIEMLARVARVAKHLLIVESEIDLAGYPRPAMVFYPGGELKGDATNWWGPNPLCMEALLRGHGFSEIEVSLHPASRSRAVFHAWRSTEMRRASLPDALNWKRQAVGDRGPHDRSRFGELTHLYRHIDPTRAATVVDVGMRWPESSNSYDLLSRYKWRGLLIGINPALRSRIESHFAGLEFVLQLCGVSDVVGERLGVLLRKHSIPYDFTLLSIDTEGSDAQVLNDLFMTEYRPEFVIVGLSARSLTDLPLCAAIQHDYAIVEQTMANIILRRKFGAKRKRRGWRRLLPRRRR